MKVVVVRHGETEENVKRIMMGHRHGTLSKKGMIQAKKLAMKLRNQQIDAIFSSDLKRARDTTREIAKYHKVPIFYAKALREQNYGVFQGRPLEELIGVKSARSRIAFRPLGGESLADLKLRVHKFMLGLGAKYYNKTILISAHAGVVWSLYSIYGHVPLARLVKMKPKNTGILVIQTEKNRSKILKDDVF